MLKDSWVEDFVHLCWENPTECEFEDNSEWLCLLYEPFGYKPFLDIYTYLKDRVELADGFYRRGYPEHDEPINPGYKILAAARIDKFLTFTCDPNKAKKCTKELCHINGGPCFSTTNYKESIHWTEEEDIS